MNEEKKNSKAKENNNKSGKLQKRRETRRLEAIARQVARIQLCERNLEKAKNRRDAGQKLGRAQLTLQKIRGGVSHDELAKQFEKRPVTAPAEKGK